MFVTTVTVEGVQIGYAEGSTFGGSRHAATDSVSDDHLDTLADWVIETCEQVEA